MVKGTAKAWKFVILITLGLSLVGQTGWARKAYVTDSFRISLRRGPSIENKILRFVPSGLPVEILESEEGWSRVLVSEGEGQALEGWALSRYLITREPWENQTKSLQHQNALLKEEVAFAKKEVHVENGRAKKLKEGQAETLRTIDGLIRENENLKSSQMTQWFVTGALVLLLGTLGGLAIGKPRKKQKTLYY